MAKDWYRTRLTGVRWPPERQKEIRRCRNGEPLTLVLETAEQPYNAISVASARGVSVGYVPEGVAEVILPAMSSGARVEAFIDDPRRDEDQRDVYLVGLTIKLREVTE